MNNVMNQKGDKVIEYHAGAQWRSVRRKFEWYVVFPCEYFITPPVLAMVAAFVCQAPKRRLTGKLDPHTELTVSKVPLPESG